MRGDNVHGICVHCGTEGSPPHAWGQRNVNQDCDICHRFTPTCVGTTEKHVFLVFLYTGSPPHAWGQRSGCSTAATPQTVHPHMRGDNVLTGGGGRHLYGSPPHAWGQRFVKLRQTGATRFTPTCVGTTAIHLDAGLVKRVHPHMRGDNGGDRPRRIYQQVHPHMRGDNEIGKRYCEVIPGSPPHAWGQHY